MTKPRPPMSVHQALDRIAGHVPGGIDEMAREVERQPGTVRAWSDPDRPEDVPLPAAAKLDILYRRHGGQGWPLHDAYTLQLELAANREFGGQFELARLGAEVARETGDVTAAIIEAALPGADPREAGRKVLKEGAEAISRIKDAMSAAEHLASNDQAQEAPP